MFLLGHDPFLASQIETFVTLTIVNPDCTVNLFQLKKHLNPSRFGNKNYKLIILLLIIAEATSHSVRGTVTQDTTAIILCSFYFTSGKITYNYNNNKYRKSNKDNTNFGHVLSAIFYTYLIVIIISTREVFLRI